ncbi:MAG: DUF1638 domain-containing protein [Ilumatobacteraceae bacterium]
MRPLVIACGALTADLRAVLQINDLADAVEVTYLPANYHSRPDKIVPALRPLIEAAVAADRHVFVAYADCGTGGLLDALLAEYPGIDRLPGAHCYEFFAGSIEFATMHEDELGTLYVTDFLAKHFDSLVWGGLGLDRFPQLRDMYFGNYTRVMLLAQTEDAAITACAEEAAVRLGLRFERRFVGRSGLGDPVAVAINRTHAGAHQYVDSQGALV